MAVYHNGWLAADRRAHIECGHYIWHIKCVSVTIILGRYTVYFRLVVREE